MNLDLETISIQFPAAAEYVSNIFLIHRDYGSVSNQRLADWMGVTTPAVTQALGRLKKLELVDYHRYEPVCLTELGRVYALRVLRRHYLLEHLLVRLLDFPWDKADVEARVLQNQISQDLEDHLDAKLGSPQTCPHGNPLPGTTVEAKLLSAARLSEAVAGSDVLILRITEEGEAIPDMLSVCQSFGIKPGGHFNVVEKVADGLRLLRYDPKTGQKLFPDFALPLELATHIRFEPLELDFPNLTS